MRLVKNSMSPCESVTLLLRLCWCDPGGWRFADDFCFCLWINLMSILMLKCTLLIKCPGSVVPLFFLPLDLSSYLLSFSLLGKTSHLQCIEFSAKFVFESLCANKKIVLINILYVKINWKYWTYIENIWTYCIWSVYWSFWFRSPPNLDLGLPGGHPPNH